MRFAVKTTLIVFVSLLTYPGLSAQNRGDIEAINQLLDRYGALEEAMDMMAQATLMSEDRVWVGDGAGRRTDQSKNMTIQQATFDLLQETVPGIRWFVEDRDRLIRFYGNGDVAVVSFFRYATYLVPPETPPEIAEGFAAPAPTAFTAVMEKSGGEWQIVHTHVSNLVPPAVG